MRARDIVILGALVLLVLALTIVEKYGEHRREAQRQQEAAIERLQWQNRMGDMLDERWKDLSTGLRRSLDSLVRATVAGGVGEDSLAAIMAEIPAGDTTHAPFPAGSAVPAKASTPVIDSAAYAVVRDYYKALAALPIDLNTYERRVAANEVASLVRAKFGLSVARFDSLLALVPE
jgi:hypothetical protein